MIAGNSDSRSGLTAAISVHELSIMQSALEVILRRAQEARAGKVCAVALRVGALSGAVPEALEAAFAALTPGTTAHGAALHIERVPAKFWCEACRCEFSAVDLLAECGRCGQVSGDLRAGRELEIASIEVE